MIELVVLDIDGVVTDGSVIVDSEGREQKRISMRDMDAVFELRRRGYRLAAVTGEDTDIVDYFEKRFPWECFCRGIKKKEDAVRRIGREAGVPMEHVCYVGDGRHDAGPLACAGLGVCPADAAGAARDAADAVLQNAGGAGCLWELVQLLERYDGREGAHRCFFGRLKEHADVFRKMASDQELAGAVAEVGDRMMDIFRAGGAVWFCGNGGSAADAQHIAAEFVGRFCRERPGLNAEALSVNTSALTAVGNDYGFRRVFARQLEAKAHAGDMLVGISTSGASENVLEALRYAAGHGIAAVLMTGGRRGPQAEDAAGYRIRVPSLSAPRIQEAHVFIGHVLAEYVEHGLFGQAHPGGPRQDGRGVQEPCGGMNGTG